MGNERPPMKLSILIICGAAILTGCTSTSAMNSPETETEKATALARKKAEAQLHESMASLLNRDAYVDLQAGSKPTAGVMAAN